MALAEPVLKHRMALTFAARADGETVASVIARLDGAARARGAHGPSPGPRRRRRSPGRRETDAALTLAQRLPRLVARGAARRRDRCRTASTAAGAPGPARPSGSSAPSSPARRRSAIDWRRSARDDHLYVREREWEAAHTVWLWIDRSASMDFVSDLAQAPKIERALVLGLALADTFVDARRARRPARPDARRARSRQIVEKLAEALVADRWRSTTTCRRARRVAPLDEAVLISDFLRRLDEIASGRRGASRRAARAAISCMIVDPVEETFPFEGQADAARSRGRRRGCASATPAPGARPIATRHRGASRRARRTSRAGAAGRLTIHRTDRPATRRRCAS